MKKIMRIPVHKRESSEEKEPFLSCLLAAFYVCKFSRTYKQLAVARVGGGT